MKRKFIKSILALSFILFSIILLMSCSKKDNTLKLKDEANNEYIVEKTDDEAEVKKVISSMSKLNINYPKKAELKMVYDGGINITTDNYYLDFYDSEFKLNFGLDLSKVNKDNNKIDENFEFYFDLDSEFYLNLMNYSTSESFQKQLISLPLKIQTKNDGDFVFINIGNDFYLSTTLLDYFLSDLIKNISAYQSFLKNSKTAILKSKALEEINNSSLLDKVENVTTYNTGYGIFSSLINNLNITYYDIKIVEVEGNLVTFSLNANEIAKNTTSNFNSILYMTFDASLMLPTSIKVNNFTSNGLIRELFDFPLELENSNIEINISYNTYNQPEIDVSGYSYM